MLTYEEAKDVVLAHLPDFTPEGVALPDLLGRVLAEPVVSPIDLPPFDNSAVDGYALCLNGPALSFRVIGELAAGAQEMIGLQPGRAVRVFTGSRLPEGCEAVVMQEEVLADAGVIHLKELPERGEHMRRKGEELSAGARVFGCGTLVTPAVLGALATLGLSEAIVNGLPKVAVIGTGNELQSPGQPLAIGQVYESNTYAVEAALRAQGLTRITRNRVADDAEETREALERALKVADVVVVCGGVSVGEYDFVKPALASLGVQELVWRVKIKPGKPFYFGLGPKGQAVFGLPGNPVSTLTIYYLFLRPWLLAAMGREEPARPLQMKALHDMPTAKGRDEFLRAKICDDGVELLEAQGSHMMTGLAGADSLVRIRSYSATRKGQLVEVLPLAWS